MAAARRWGLAGAVNYVRALPLRYHKGISQRGHLLGSQHVASLRKGECRAQGAL